MPSKGIVVGLTGQSGAGKSLVCNLLLNRGLRVVDADVVARKVVDKGKDCLVELVMEFGVDILRQDSTLNRKKLAKIVFGNEEKLETLNRIIFPHIIGEINRRIEDMMNAGAQAVFLDAPTLFESGYDKQCDKIVCVVAPDWLRLQRIVGRDKISEEDSRARMDSQLSEAFFISHADYVIENIGDLASLRESVLAMLRHFGIRPENKGADG